jgi:hypothetical protein
MPLVLAFLALLPVLLAAVRYPVYLTHVFPTWPLFHT